MKMRHSESRELAAVLGLACLLGAAGCKTFTSTADDLERERRYARESQRNAWAGLWSLFAPPVCSSDYYGGCGGGVGLYPLATGPANARPWVGNAAAGGLPHGCQRGR